MQSVRLFIVLSLVSFASGREFTAYGVPLETHCRQLKEFYHSFLTIENLPSSERLSEQILSLKEEHWNALCNATREVKLFEEQPPIVGEAQPGERRLRRASDATPVPKPITETPYLALGFITPVSDFLDDGGNEGTTLMLRCRWDVENDLFMKQVVLSNVVFAVETVNGIMPENIDILGFSIPNPGKLILAAVIIASKVALAVVNDLIAKCNFADGFHSDSQRVQSIDNLEMLLTDIAEVQYTLDYRNAMAPVTLKISQIKPRPSGDVKYETFKQFIVTTKLDGALVNPTKWKFEGSVDNNVKVSTDLTSGTIVTKISDGFYKIEIGLPPTISAYNIFQFTVEYYVSIEDDLTVSHTATSRTYTGSSMFVEKVVF